MHILGFEYGRKHEAFKKIIDSKLDSEESFNAIDIDTIWSMSKITLRNNESIVLNLKPDSPLTESLIKYLNDEFANI
jgi:hypothetical protein